MLADLVMTQLRGAFDTFIDNASRVGRSPDAAHQPHPSDGAMDMYLNLYDEFQKDRGRCVRPGIRIQDCTGASLSLSPHDSWITKVMSVFLLGRSCTAQPKPQHRYATLQRITHALREAIGAAPVALGDHQHAMADLDAQLGAGIQGTFGAFRRSADTLRAKLTALEGQMATLLQQHPVLATHIREQVTWDNYRVESSCFELLIVLHRLRKTHSTLVALRKRTQTCFVFCFCFVFFLFLSPASFFCSSLYIHLNE